MTPPVCACGRRPDCGSHYNLTFDIEYASFYDYVWKASYRPHGPVHLFIGGYLNCESALEEMRHYGLTDIQINLLKWYPFKYVKDAWRYKLTESPTCSADTPQQECHMQCNIDPSNIEDNQIAMNMLSTWVGDWVMDITNKTVAFKLIEQTLCNTAFVLGEQVLIRATHPRRGRRAPHVHSGLLFTLPRGLSPTQVEAASPLDVTFWPIHPTMDRLMQYKRIVNDFAFANWSSPHGPTVYCVTAQCKGHHAYDLTPSRTLYERSDGSYVYEYLTNHEVLKMTHPREYQMPYIYDNFRWDHCEEEGYMFPGAPATEDPTFDASSSPRNASSPPPGGYSP